MPPPTGLISAPIVAVRRRRVPPQLVYDLTVESAHEFLADGVLVHNCEWDASLPWSPDRVDALVWAITALKPWTGAVAVARSSERRPGKPAPAKRARTVGRPQARGALPPIRRLR